MFEIRMKKKRSLESGSCRVLYRLDIHGKMPAKDAAFVRLSSTSPVPAE
jgi:hypothetical protein